MKTRSSRGNSANYLEINNKGHKTKQKSVVGSSLRVDSAAQYVSNRPFNQPYHTNLHPRS